MKKILLIVIPLLLISIGIVISENRLNLETQNNNGLVETKPQLTNTPTPIFSPYTAKLEIYTNGTKRIFTAKMYHNLSEDVFIRTPDPSVVHVQKPDTTWADLFETLPMSLSKECLITGTGQQFCANKTQSLLFYINDNIDKNALDKEIKPNDFLKVVYE